MAFKHIGIVSPGDMGQALAQRYIESGFNVFTALNMRSDRTKRMAKEANLIDVGSIDKLTEHCDLIFSILDPAAALEVATEAARALKINRRKIVFVECNAIAPGKMRTIDDLMSAEGSRCIDACILDRPPRNGNTTCIYVSGPHACELEQLTVPQIDIRVLSKRMGDASAVKICLSALQKGKVTLVLETLIAARRLGIESEIAEMLAGKHRRLCDEVIVDLPKIVPRAYRLVPEMLEIAKTFASVGMTSRIFEGAAAMYELIDAAKFSAAIFDDPDTLVQGRNIIRELAER